MKNYKVAIYKVGMDIDLQPNDVNFAQQEIVNVIDILRAHGDQVSILTNKKETGQIMAKVEYVDYRTDIEDDYDILLVFNGPYPKNIIGEYEDIKYFAEHAVKSYFIVTDLRIKLYPQFHELFDKVLTQSARQIAEINAPQAFNGMPQSVLFGATFINSPEKTLQFVFGGNERDRTEDFIEYIARPNVEYYGKAPTLNHTDNRIPTAEYLKRLRKALYSIVIADKEYNRHGFVTQRYFECLANNVIPFVDAKYDPDEIIVRKNDFRRVSNYREVLDKMHQLENDQKLYDETLRRQHLEIYMNRGLYGDFTRECLLQIEGEEYE